jgi:hypothetical protein
MPTNLAVSRGRRLAGAAALMATGAGITAVAVHDRHWIEWGLVGFAGVVGVAGVGLSRRSMVAQVLSRATAWVVLVPTALVTAVSTLGNHAPEPAALALAAGSAAALALARPMLHTEEARREFAPNAFRRWLLAGATASAATGIVSAMAGLDMIGWRPATALALATVGLALVASAIGVARMRAWGILLGGLTSFVALASALVLRDAAGFALSLAAIPGLLLVLPVLLSKRDRAKANATSYVRVADAGASVHLPVRLRVADELGEAEREEREERDAREAIAHAPADRSMHA